MEVLPGSDPQWFMLAVMPRHEKKIASKLASKGFETLLPTYESRRQWSDRVKMIEAPLFPLYIFCRYALKDRSAVLRTPGVMSGVGGAGPAVRVADSDIETIRKLAGSGYALEPAARLNVGQRVRLGSSLAGISGLLVREGATCQVAINFEPLKLGIIVTVPRELIDATE